jgi:hypothetical protein
MALSRRAEYCALCLLYPYQWCCVIWDTLISGAASFGIPLSVVLRHLGYPYQWCCVIWDTLIRGAASFGIPLSVVLRHLGCVFSFSNFFTTVARKNMIMKT